MWGPVREESGGDAVLEADLGGFGGGDGREIEVSGEKKIPMNEESCSGSNSTVWSGDGDSSHRRSFAGENRTFHLLAFAYSFAEAPRVQYHSHYLSLWLLILQILL